jgi:hypothetical protein
VKRRSAKEVFSGYEPVNRTVLLIAFAIFIAFAVVSYIANHNRIDENRAALARIAEVDRIGRARSCEVRDALIEVLRRVIETSYAGTSSSAPFQVLIDGKPAVLEVVTSPQAERSRDDSKNRVLAELDAVPTCEGIEDSLDAAALAELSE